MQPAHAAEGSTDVHLEVPPGSVDPLSPPKQRRRITGAVLGKEGRTELLEENRQLRIELDAMKYRSRRLESIARKQKKELLRKDVLLQKYRDQLVGMFEGYDDAVRINKPKASLRGAGGSRDRSGEVDMTLAIAGSGGGGGGGGSGGNGPTRGSGDGAGRGEADIAAEDEIDGRGIGRGLQRSKRQEHALDDNISISPDQEDDGLSIYTGGSGSHDGFDEQMLGENSRCPEDSRYGGDDSMMQYKRRRRAPAWSPDEEMVFMETYEKYGCQWKMFQEALPGRSRRQIQSHGSYLIRQGKLLKKNSRPWQRRKPRQEVPSVTVKEGDGELDAGEASEQ